MSGKFSSFVLLYFLIKSQKQMGNFVVEKRFTQFPDVFGQCATHKFQSNLLFLLFVLRKKFVIIGQSIPHFIYSLLNYHTPRSLSPSKFKSALFLCSTETLQRKVRDPHNLQSNLAHQTDFIGDSCSVRHIQELIYLEFDLKQIEMKRVCETFREWFHSHILIHNNFRGGKKTMRKMDFNQYERLLYNKKCHFIKSCKLTPRDYAIKFHFPLASLSIFPFLCDKRWSCV